MLQALVVLLCVAYDVYRVLARDDETVPAPEAQPQRTDAPAEKPAELPEARVVSGDAGRPRRLEPLESAAPAVTKPTEGDEPARLR